MRTVAFLCMVLLLRSSLWAQHKTTVRPPTTAAITSPQELFKRLSPSVFIVEVLDLNDSVIAFGSGVAVAPDLVVTNRHVMDAGEILRLRRGDNTWRAFPAWVDPDHDLGLLKAVRLNAPPVSLRRSPTVAVGERVYAIGTPEGLELTLSEGIVSGLREYENGKVIQTSAPISPGSSGGGLFDEQGQLVGITSFGLVDGQSLNFALPADWVQALPRQRTLGTPLDQQRPTTKYEKVFTQRGVAINNLQTFVDMRRLEHGSRMPRDGGTAVSNLILRQLVFECLRDKDSPDCMENWPAWQKASLYRLDLREAIRARQPSRDELEGDVLDRARSVWSDLTDVYCKERSGGLYTDLDNKIRRCP